jgi:hypothetical protein
MLQLLEPRWLRAVDLTNGVLTITGTPGADGLVITDPATSSATATLDVRLNGDAVRSFPPQQISNILIELSGGNDVAELGAVSKPALVLGGNGDDKIQGGGARHTLVGGDGDDAIDARGDVRPRR